MFSFIDLADPEVSTEKKAGEMKYEKLNKTSRSHNNSGQSCL